MDYYEEAVFAYLTGSKSRFVNAQFELPWANLKGGSCPDFVVVDFETRTIYVIEVCSASNVNGLIKRVINREDRWLIPLRAHFAQLRANFQDWPYHVTIFVREEIIKSTRRKVAPYPDVSVLSLDAVVFPWRWLWDGQRAINPLH